MGGRNENKGLEWGYGDFVGRCCVSLGWMGRWDASVGVYLVVLQVCR